MLQKFRNNLNNPSPRFAFWFILLVVVFPWVFFLTYTWSIPVSPDRPSESNAVTAKSDGSKSGDIATIIEGVVPGSSVLLSDAQFNVGSSARPPFEVIVNTTASDCFDAKMKLLDIMRSLYMDDVARAQISRVLVNMPGYLSASLGSNDGRGVSSDAWQDNGPTNFFTILRQSGRGDIEGIALSGRTWGRGIAGCN